jgi:MFS family permease
MLPEAITMVPFAPVGGLLYDRIGARWPTVIGMLIVAFNTYLMSFITWDLTRESVMLWTSIRSIGYVLAIVPVLTLGIAAVPAKDTDPGRPRRRIGCVDTSHRSAVNSPPDNRRPG